MKPKYPFAIASVATFIVDARDTLLVGRRIYNTTQPKISDWCLPGGKVDYNETVEQAAVREIKEECGLVINPANLTFLDFKKEDYPNFGGHYVCFYYATKFLEHAICDIPEPTKIDQWLWLEKHKIPYPLFGEASNVLSKHYKTIFP